MVQHFHRKIIAGVAALSIFVTSVGAGSASAQNLQHPQHNRNTGVEQAIVAVGVLALFAALASNNKKKKRKKEQQAAIVHPPAPQPAQPSYPPQPAPQVQQPVHPAPHHVPARPLPPRAQALGLPQQCLRVHDTDQGRARFAERLNNSL